MEQFDVLGRITELCESKGWTRYKLSKQTGIPISTINNMYLRTNCPTIPTLEHICDGLGITMAQFFNHGDHTDLSDEQEEILILWDSLVPEDKKLARAYLKGLAKQ